MSIAPGTRGRRLESWLWTGPLGHLLGGLLDFAGALWRYLIGRARTAHRARAHSRAPRR
ncbi:MAG TPA: hypothetical protein VGF15_03590 [Solirubrobacteraceae bacterium]|jgi:hypothetical protein